MQCGFGNGENARCILYVCTFFHTGARRHNVHILAGTLSRHILHTFTAPPLFRLLFLFLKKNAYTSRTPEEELRPAKSVHTGPPRFALFCMHPCWMQCGKKCTPKPDPASRMITVFQDDCERNNFKTFFKIGFILCIFQHIIYVTKRWIT
mgnify:CR=1 FL=1